MDTQYKTLLSSRPFSSFFFARIRGTSYPRASHSTQNRIYLHMYTDWYNRFYHWEGTHQTILSLIWYTNSLSRDIFSLCLFVELMIVVLDVRSILCWLHLDIHFYFLAFSRVSVCMANIQQLFLQHPLWQYTFIFSAAPKAPPNFFSLFILFSLCTHNTEYTQRIFIPDALQYKYIYRILSRMIVNWMQEKNLCFFCVCFFWICFILFLFSSRALLLLFRLYIFFSV